MRLGVWMCVWFALLASPHTARAQEGSEGVARSHYERGVALFDESQFVAALAEFEAAYALSSRPSLLFNIGQIHARLGHAVEAADTLARYLDEARDVSSERRALVESEIATQRGRIGRVRVNVDVAGATVSLDDVDRGESPLADPIHVSTGEHVLAVSAAGHETSRQRFRLAGGEERTIDVHLAPLSGAAMPSASGAPFPVLTVIGSVLGGAGLVTWAVGGIITLTEDATLAGCSPDCTTEETATIEVSTLVADVGLGVLVVGAALAIIGAVLELSGSGDRESSGVALGAGGLEVWW